MCQLGLRGLLAALALACVVSAVGNMVVYDEHKYTDLYEALQVVGSSGERGGEYFLQGTFYGNTFGLPTDAKRIIFTSIDPNEPATIVGKNWAQGRKGIELRYVNLVDDHAERLNEEAIELMFG